MKSLLLLSVIVASTLACTPPPTLASARPLEVESTLVSLESSDDPSRGPEGASVTVVVFGDYTCMHCRRTSAYLKAMLADDPDLRVVWKHFPRNDEDAVSAAVLAHALRELGGGPAHWAFHDTLFSEELTDRELHQRIALALVSGRARVEADNKTIAETAQRVGVDRVRASVELGSLLGVRALPTMFLNGRRMVGVEDEASLRRAVVVERQAVRDLVAEGLSVSVAKERRLRAAAEEDPSLFVRAAPEGAAEQAAEEPSGDVGGREPERLSDTVYRVPIGSSPARGPADAPVTVVAFWDFECRHCRRAAAVWRDLEREFAGKVRFVPKHLPLEGHVEGKRAALFATWVQGRLGSEAFFRVHDALFQRPLEDETYRELARAEGLDPALALRAISEETTLPVVEDDLLAADDVGARSTPTFFINGRAIVGGLPAEDFRGAIEEELARSAELSATGVPPSKIYESRIAEGFSLPSPPRVEPPVIAPGTPVLGPKDAPLSLHVFADFDCHFCRVNAANVARLQREMEGKLRVVFHNHPVRGERGRRAALAGLEAQRQKGSEAFFRFHDRLFTTEEKLSDELLASTFRDLGLDPSRLPDAFADPKLAAMIERELATGAELGLTGTPLSILNGYKLAGAVPYVRLRKVARLALAERASTTPMTRQTRP
jgi:protein-disulfide isomerase